MRDEYIREEVIACKGNLSKAARHLDLDYAEVKRRFGDISIEPIVRPTGPMPDSIATLGREGWGAHVIAVKANGSQWPARFTHAIHDGRKKFDAGTHIMCQEKRADGWIVLYLVPRRYPLRRPQPYFSRSSVF